MLSAYSTLAPRPSPLAPPRGITLVEMLIAVAITLVMMAAVVTVFANISDSVQKRRATVEMSNSLRHVRNVLQRDLAGATCPTIPWQRPESNHGYFEIIEGPRADFWPSSLILNYETSSIPGSQTQILQQKIAENELSSQAVTDATGLGDYDDILMLTVRNESEPFVGRVPGDIRQSDGSLRPYYSRNNPNDQWPDSTIRSSLAEVVWFAVENPADAQNQDGVEYFGEPGFRTVYRRTLLIAPSLDPYRRVDNNGTVVESYPGVVRIMEVLTQQQVPQAIAALISFQERYDLSVRLEWDPLLQFGSGDPGRWKLVANTLGDLTKRENRYEHHGHLFGALTTRYPFAAVSTGAGIQGPNLTFVSDRDFGSGTGARGQAGLGRFDSAVSFALTNPGEGYLARPFVYINADCERPATVRALVKAGATPAEQQVVYLTAGLVPLGGDRRGEDVMLTDALAFDLRVYDPGAPLLGNEAAPDVVVEPGDAGWSQYLDSQFVDKTVIFGYGAYVDLGYLGLHNNWRSVSLTSSLEQLNGVIDPQFAGPPRLRSKLNLWGQLDPYYEPYRVYDTWSFHYENNGIDEDGALGAIDPVTGLPIVDQGTNGFDDAVPYEVLPSTDPPSYITERRHGVDDPGERETSPPYDVPLRGVQVRLRAYERDSRQVREVSVKQHFVPE